MKDLQIIMQRKEENSQKVQRLDRIQIAVSVIITITCLILAYAGIRFPKDRLYTIDDKSETFSMMNQVIPVKINLLDSVWGSVEIDSMDEVGEYYLMTQTLPIAQSVDGELLHENSVMGTISFVEGDDVNFAAGAYIVIDDVIYGDENTKLSVKAHTDRLCRWLFTKENLVELIGSHDRVVLRSGDERINLSMDQKRKLREVLLEGEALKDSGELSDAMRTKGEGVAQIEIYVSDREEKTPVVYVVLFENGLCMVHDERFVGSIMQLRSDVLAVSREFLEE